MTDSQFISALKKGDQIAFRQLIDQYSKTIYNLCLSILQNEEDAESATQENFITIFALIKITPVYGVI